MSDKPEPVTTWKGALGEVLIALLTSFATEAGSVLANRFLAKEEIVLGEKDVKSDDDVVT